MSANQNQDLKIINEKFKFMGFLDHARWCDSSEKKDVSNYYSINMANRDASGEELLLTHFLGYITNRQTPFERIFEQLDYIFSQLVHDFKFTKRSVNELFSPDDIWALRYQHPSWSLMIQGGLVLHTPGLVLVFCYHGLQYRSTA